MMRRAAFFLIALLAAQLAVAQQKMNQALRHYVAGHRGQDQVVDLIARGGRSCLEAEVKRLGGTVKMGMRDIVSFRIPVDAIEELSRVSCLKSFEFSLEEGVALNDSARYKSRIQLVQQGAVPLPMPYTGKGVIVGIIDAGSDFRHADFLLSDGRTRVLKYWDQYCSTNTALIPAAFGYGQVWDSTVINTGTIPYCGSSIDHNFGHGTTVMGAAASNGNATGNYVGGATEADLIVVGNKLSVPNWRSTMVDAVKFILDEATALGRPCVINCSLGAYLGSHDGLDAHALLIDSMLNSAPGRIMVQAAGNIGYVQAHVRHTIGADTTYTWFYDTNGTGIGAVGTQWWDCWADSADIANVQYAVGADKVQPALDFRGRTPFHPLLLDSLVIDSLWSESGNFLGLVVFEAHPRGAQVNLQVRMYQVDSTTYRWRFMTTGSGLIDIWASEPIGLSMVIPADSLPVPDPLYMAPDLDMNTVDSWPCSPSVLTVANYNNESSYIAANGVLVDYFTTEGSIATSSSHGPTRDGRIKPDIGAPGDITLSAGPPATLAAYLLNANIVKLSSDSVHLRNGGTSMAAPVVTGAVALFLEKCPYAMPSDVITVFTSNTATDAFTGTVPNNTWGYGKLDAFAAMISTNFTYDPTLALLGPAIFCPGDTSAVSADPTFDRYVWSNGLVSSPEYMGGAFDDGPLWVTMATQEGCTANSDTAYFNLYPAPIAPTITPSADWLDSSPAVTYQWYLDGSPIPGATSQSYQPTANGVYAVITTDVNGCSATSDPYTLMSVGIDQAHGASFVCWPSPTQDELFIALAVTGQVNYAIMDAGGRSVEQGVLSVKEGRGRIALADVAAGTYALRVTPIDGEGAARTVLFTVR